MAWWLTLITGGIVLGTIVEVVNRVLGRFAAGICLFTGAVCLGTLAGALL